jgi:hypothetical protein
MSAKGDQVGERFVKVMGIVDYITKPFSPEAITAVVQHTVAKYQGADAPRATRSPRRDLADGGAGAARALAALRGVLTDVVAARVAALFALADAAGDTDGERDAGVPTDAAAIADTVRSALDDDALGDVVAGSIRWLFDRRAALRRRAAGDPAGRDPAAARSPGAVGRAVDGPRRDPHRRLLPPRPDRSGAGRGVADDLLLGRYIVDSELMPRGDFDAFVASRATGRLIGEQLVRLGHLSPADRRRRWCARPRAGVRGAALALRIVPLRRRAARRRRRWPRPRSSSTSRPC